MPVFERKFVPNVMSYRQISLSKTRAFCCAILRFLSNSGRRMSCRVTTLWAITWPDNVLIFLDAERSWRTTPWGKLDFLMRQQDAHESRGMRNNCLLPIAPIVLTVQMVAGVLFHGMILGPWKQYSMSSLNTLYSLIEAMEAFPSVSLSAIVLSTVQLVMLSEDKVCWASKWISLCRVHETVWSCLSSTVDFKTLSSVVQYSGNETSSRLSGTKTHNGTLGLVSMSDSEGAVTYSRLLWVVQWLNLALNLAMRLSTRALCSSACSFLAARLQCLEGGCI